jgi:hypothetical protein
MSTTTVVNKADSTDVLGNARQMVSQLQQQAKNGQIDGQLLDQLESVLDVTVDSAKDAQASGMSAMSDVSKTSDPSMPTTPSGSSSDSSSSSSSSSSVPSAPSTPSNSSSSSSSDDDTNPFQSGDTSMTSVPSSAQKVDQPLATKPPRVNLLFDHISEYEQILPNFIKALEGDPKALTGGSVKAAQMVTGNDQQKFNEIFKMAQFAILNEGGWNKDNLGKLSGLAQMNDGSLAKGITASSVPGIYLIRLAKLMLPVYAGLTNRLPAQSPQGMSSDYATWKAQLGFGNISWTGFFRVAEANIGVNPPTNFVTFTTPFNDIAVQDSVTLKALSTTRGYSDPMQISVIKSMSALLVGQERVLLGSNVAALAVPTGLTVTAGSTGGTLSNSGSAGTYYVSVTALSYEGWLNSNKGGSAGVGETTAVISSQATTSTSSTNSLVALWNPVENAVAYNVYLSAQGAASGSANLWYASVVTTKCTITAAAGSAGNQPPAADCSVNATGIEGIIGQCENSTLYTKAISSKVTITNQKGAGLTTGAGGIVEFDTILAGLWSNWQIAPSLMLMSPNMNGTVVGKLLALGGAGGFYRIDVGNERNKVQGGMMVTGYVNKFAPFADGTPKMIDIIPHPYLPDGTVLFMTETIPYPMGNESRGFVRDVLIPYTYFPLPSQASGVNQTTYNYSITTSEVLEGYLPQPQTALVGVDYTL